MKSKPIAPLHFRKYSQLPVESSELIYQALRFLVKIPNFCSREGTVVIVPSILYMILGVIRESSRIDTFCSLKNEEVPIVSNTIPGQISAGAAAATAV